MTDQQNTNQGGGQQDDPQGSGQGQGSSAVVISEEVKSKFPELTAQIIASESMDDEEREYWIQILPIMTDEQVQKLRDILSREQAELAKIDEEYAEKAESLNSKHVNEWNAFASKQKREELQDAEQESRSQENPESLLSQL